MNKLLWVILFSLFAHNAFSQAMRETSFDDRPICESVGGVWRQFGNGCADQCRAKLNKFEICTQEVVGGCDCGKGRCWNGETCVLLKDYSEIYAAEVEQDQKVLDAAKKERQKMAKKNQQSILERISKNAAIITKNISDSAKGVSNTIAQSNNKVDNDPSKQVTEDRQALIPEVFKKQQEAAKKQNDDSKGFFGKLFSSPSDVKPVSATNGNNNSNVAVLPANPSTADNSTALQNNTDPTSPITTIPELPEIALPN